MTQAFVSVQCHMSPRDPAVCKQALALGAIAFLAKPLQDDLELFVNTVRAVLEKAGGSSS